MMIINVTLICKKNCFENWKWKFIETWSGWHAFNAKFRHSTLNAPNLWRLIWKIERYRVKPVSSYYILPQILTPLTLHISFKSVRLRRSAGHHVQICDDTNPILFINSIFTAHLSKWLDLNKWIIVSN